MKPIQVAVVGCGSIGKRHAAVVDVDSDVRLVGLCDVEPGRMAALGELYDGVPCFAEFATLLEECPAELVCICTPHALHAPMSIAAARAGKHVLVEKPMALSSADCEQMMSVAAENRVTLYVVKQNRYNAPIVLCQRALQERWLGAVHSIECNVLWNRHPGYYADSNWRGRLDQEGGALFTQASHFVDLLVWWFGDVVESCAFLARKSHQIELEDNGRALVTFSSGVLGSLSWSTTVYRENYEGSITLLGENGTIKIGGKYLNRIDTWDVGDHEIPADIELTDQPNLYGRYQGTSSNHHRVLADVVQHLRQGEVEVVMGGEGLRCVQAIEKIYESARWVDDAGALFRGEDRP